MLQRLQMRRRADRSDEDRYNMVVEEQYNGQETYRCSICGFHYTTAETARNCEDYCRTHNGCRSDLAKQALETGGPDG
jgi:rubrerythrin